MGIKGQIWRSKLLPLGVLLFVIAIRISAARASSSPTTLPPVTTSDGPKLVVAGDEARVVLVGDGLIEQEQFAGFIEARLARLFPAKRIICRDIGWSGDDVFGSARVEGYHNPAGLQRLLKEAEELKPTHILVGYGSIESFDGEAGLKPFVDGYGKLLDALNKLTPNLVLLSPSFHEDLGRPLPDPAIHNRDIEQYAQAVRQLADQRHLPFVDLFRPIRQAMAACPAVRFTHNGLELNECGYWLVAAEVEKQLGLSPSPSVIDLPKGPVEVTVPAAAPAPPAAIAQYARTICPEGLRVRAVGLAPGRWSLHIDGREVMTGSAEQWAAGLLLTDLDVQQPEKLRQAVVCANELYHRRSRPFNDHPRHYTYIAGDYALYDRELADQDATIFSLAQPVKHTFALETIP